mmetsp:Transcript_143368/g.458245  ORF Transcript_143368/g.458245 Transcript_143368/m.458245 type:complete len:94 (-) Transcript_143368:1838-2119(-)
MPVRLRRFLVRRRHPFEGDSAEVLACSSLVRHKMFQSQAMPMWPCMLRRLQMTLRPPPCHSPRRPYFKGFALEVLAASIRAPCSTSESKAMTR